MLASQALEAAPIVPYPLVLYLVELTVEPRVQREDVASTLHYPLQARARASETVLRRQDRNYTVLATQRTLRMKLWVT